MIHRECFDRILKTTVFSIMSGVLTILPACNGILSDIYDEPSSEMRTTSAGELYIDASNWLEWHYIDLREVCDGIAANPDVDTSSFWRTYAIPLTDTEQEHHPQEESNGIYTYWYDVFGSGISNREFRYFGTTAQREEPANWTFAVHRNNVRTNNGMVAATKYNSLQDLPEGTEWLKELSFTPDTWNETDVWVVQDRMLSGLVGCQGIKVNEVLSNWLTMVIPPMPPAYNLDNRVFVIKLSDGSLAALQLNDYISAAGDKCHLTINYRYPL